MSAYFIRRLMLVPITLIGITLVVFMVLRLAPGGPVERELMEATMGASAQDRGSSRDQQQGQIPAATVLAIQEKYGEDMSALRGWLVWLGVLAGENSERRARAEFPEGEMETVVTLPANAGQVRLRRDGTRATVVPGEGTLESLEPPWRVRIESPDELAKRLRRAVKDHPSADNLPWRAVVYQKEHAGVLQGNLGRSIRYGDPVWEMMLDRFPISTFYGLTTLFLIYSVCIPLGIVKALNHRTFLDSSSSVLVFMGYAVPGYALGALLLMVFSFNLGWFPLEGFTSENSASMSPVGKALDILHHAALPLACYLVGSFAFMTMMVKNNLMDNLAADYVRTATAKGVPFRAAVFRHAFRNSIIPLATTFGGNITLFVGGNFIIERVFDINGFGLLGFNAVLERDAPITMGVLFISALLMLLGQVISDFLVALVDPRITFR